MLITLQADRRTGAFTCATLFLLIPAGGGSLVTTVPHGCRHIDNKPTYLGGVACSRVSSKGRPVM